MPGMSWASHIQAEQSPCLLAAIPTPGQPGSQLARADVIPGSHQLKAGQEAYEAEKHEGGALLPSLWSSP